MKFLKNYEILKKIMKFLKNCEIFKIPPKFPREPLISKNVHQRRHLECRLVK